MMRMNFVGIQLLHPVRGRSGREHRLPGLGVLGAARAEMADVSVAAGRSQWTMDLGKKSDFVSNKIRSKCLYISLTT